MVISSESQKYEIKRNPLILRLRILNVPPSKKRQPSLPKHGKARGSATKSCISADNDVEIRHPYRNK